MLTGIKNTTYKGLEKIIDLYNFAYEKSPVTTKFLSALAGTLGGDYIAKKLSPGQNLTLRDVAFTSFAAAYQSWLYPKLIDYTNKIVKKPFVERFYKMLRINKEWAKTIIIGGLFLIPNMAYWSLLSVKNNAPITFKGAGKAGEAIAKASIPYLGADYMVTNKLDKKYCMPVWALTGIIYNTFLAAVAYLK